MSGPSVERALLKLAAAGAVLAEEGRRRGGYGVFPRGDRRRRPTARLDRATVRALQADGALEAQGGGFVLSAAGLARVRRGSAAENEAYIAQHAEIVDRSVVVADGMLRRARAIASSTLLRRLVALRDNDGAPWLSAEEIDAAERLRAYWESGQAGLVRGSDWTAPPMGGSPRGAGNAQEAALARRCDARRRLGKALDALAAPLRRVVERVCLHEDGLEALERSHGWPARSGKLALKLGLAQLAAAMLSG
jgi:hypothetical protein